MRWDYDDRRRREHNYRIIFRVGAVMLLVGVLMVLPLLLPVCVGEARADEELQDRAFQ